MGMLLTPALGQHGWVRVPCSVGLGLEWGASWGWVLPLLLQNRLLLNNSTNCEASHPFPTPSWSVSSCLLMMGKGFHNLEPSVSLTVGLPLP